MIVKGYAHETSAGEILIETVGPTENSARVNALFFEYQQMVMNGATEAVVKSAYAAASATNGGSIVPVEVRKTDG